MYREDGSVVAPWCMLLTFGDRDRKGNEFRVEVPVGKYRIHVECEGYKPLDYWYEVKSIKRKQMIKLPDLMIQKDFTAVDEDKNVQLGEATVSATKSKCTTRATPWFTMRRPLNCPMGRCSTN